MNRWAIGAAAGLAAFLAGLVHADARPRHFDANGNAARVIAHRPAGCPRAWCGCGLARYLGLRDKRLWLAENWSRLFPHTDPHSGAAAVRRGGGHVMLLREHVGGSRWRVIDFNGGRHLGWDHIRDVRGYVFVQPPMRMGAL